MEVGEVCRVWILVQSIYTRWSLLAFEGGFGGGLGSIFEALAVYGDDFGVTLGLFWDQFGVSLGICG